MSEKMVLKIMRCPTCGASLKAKNDMETITCVYCGNSIVPVTEATPVAQSGNAGAFQGTIRVEGIKTSSSALAYLEQFFEEYDWEAFSYAQSLSVAEIDKLASSLKVSSADDKNTWFVCFKAICVPFARKIEGCKEMLTSVIEEYKKDNLDAYSKFDAYKRIAAMICLHKDDIIANLEKMILNAAKYGATDEEVGGLRAEIDNVKNRAHLDLYNDVEDIPAVKTFIAEEDAKIVEALVKEGIDAASEYEKAKNLIAEEKYVDALGVLCSLKGYSDTKLLIEKIDKYFLISDVLEVAGKRYVYRKGGEYGNWSLYPTENGKVLNTELIGNISQIVTNYADILYYIDGNKKLRSCNLSTKVGAEIYTNEVEKTTILSYNRRVFLLASDGGEYYNQKKNIIELDPATGQIKVLFGNVKDIVSLTGNKMIYTITGKATSADNTSSDTVDTTLTNIVNVDTMDIVKLGDKKVTIEGFIDNYVVYTQVSPNEFNKNLYVKALNSSEPEILIEQNIFKFCDIIADKLFYYVGNSRNRSLIHVNCDGTERKEWPLYISEVLFEQGGWLYFIRKAGYNSILCKSRMDGSKFSIIAADIEKFIEIKNGYLYYINDDSALVKVRMDGSNLQALCEDVERVLAVKEDKIIFISVDDRIVTNEFTQATTKVVKSIYAVDFSGSGKIKLAYNVKSANTHDENTVYYIAAEEVKSTSSYDQSSKQVDMLYKLDVVTNAAEKMLDLQIQREEGSTSPVTVAIIVLVISFFVALIGFAAEAPGLGVVGLIAGVVALLVGVVYASNGKA